MENTFGKDSKIMYGNWSIPVQQRSFISTPMIGFKRKVNERFELYNLDEFRTSRINNKTNPLFENLYIPDKKNTLRKIHSVLTYQMENKRNSCINRDWNSVKNMKNIVDYWFIHKERPLKFRRDYDMEEEKNIVKNKTKKNKAKNIIKVSNHSLNELSNEKQAL